MKRKPTLSLRPLVVVFQSSLNVYMSRFLDLVLVPVSLVGTMLRGGDEIACERD
jgi:hypothetical protein